MAQTFSRMDLESELARTPGWSLREGHLSREFAFEDFAEAMDFVNDIAALAESRDHHPDIHVHYNRVTLELWTHTEGGLTPKDFALARDVSTLVA